MAFGSLFWRQQKVWAWARRRNIKDFPFSFLFGMVTRISRPLLPSSLFGLEQQTWSIDEKVHSWGRVVIMHETFQEGKHWLFEGMNYEFLSDYLNSSPPGETWPHKSLGVEIELECCPFLLLNFTTKISPIIYNHQDCYMFWQDQLLSTGFTYLWFK